MRQRGWYVAAGALLAAIGLLALLGRSGDGATAQSPVRLGWEGTPRVIKIDELPRDRILSGRVRNTSLRPVDITVDRIEVVDAQGRPVKSSARFLAAFAHGLYPPAQQVKPPGKFERTRLGEIATLKPGQSLPLTLSWRTKPGGAAPTEVRFGGGSLKLPAS